MFCPLFSLLQNRTGLSSILKMLSSIFLPKIGPVVLYFVVLYKKRTVHKIGHKTTDTGLIMNFHDVALRRHRRVFYPESLGCAARGQRFMRVLSEQRGFLKETSIQRNFMIHSYRKQWKPSTLAKRSPYSHHRRKRGHRQNQRCPTQPLFSYNIEVERQTTCPVNSRKFRQ